MFRSVLRLALLAAVVPLALSSCEAGEEGTFVPVNATFDVVALNDSVVPRLLPGGTCDVLHDGGRLTLFASGDFTMRLSYGTNFCNGVGSGWSGISGVGKYAIDGDEIRFRFATGQEIIGTYAPLGADAGGSFPRGQIELGFYIYTYRLVQEISEVS